MRERIIAQVSILPSFSGDGYGYGGGTILTIGAHAIPLGEGEAARSLGVEIARRWNAAQPAPHTAPGEGGAE